MAWRLDWQKQAEEAGEREERAREELRMWQDKASELDRKRRDAEIASLKLEHRAETEANLRKRAEDEAANSQLKADQEEVWRRRWQAKAEVEEKLRNSWQQKAKASENDCQQWQRRAKEQGILLKEEAGYRQRAEAEALEWQEKAQSEESCRKRLEEEIQELKKKFEEEETLRRQCEQLAEREECLRKQWHVTGEQNKRRRIDGQMQIEREEKEKACSQQLAPQQILIQLLGQVD